jgi:hypothetical protein
MRWFFFLLIVLLARHPATAQVVPPKPDSTAVPPLPPAGTLAAAPMPAAPTGLSRPAKAALWGLIPGGGQIYNRDYWKVPIVYATLGGMGYLISFNNRLFREFRTAYDIRLNKGIDTNPRTKNFTSVSNLARARDAYRRNRDLSIIGTIALYGASLAEALVDAHLADFTISDDLSLHAAPTLVPTASAAPTPGLGLTLRLH